jgi:site-specific recombinase
VWFGAWNNSFYFSAQKNSVKEILQHIVNHPKGSDISPLIKLVKYIRPGLFSGTKRSEKRIIDLTEFLQNNAAERTALKNYLHDVFANTSHLSLYSEAGILSSEGFFSEIVKKIGHVLLPPVHKNDELRDVFDQLFYKKTDHVWMGTINPEVLAQLFSVIFGNDFNPKHLISALEILTHRVTAANLESDIIGRYPELKTPHSPFLRLNKKLIDLVQEFERNGYVSDAAFDDALRVLGDCFSANELMQKDQHTKGASLNLTYRLKRTEQHLLRLELLINIVKEKDLNARNVLSARFLQQLVLFENKRNSVKELFLKNIGFLAYQVTEHAGRTGEHYITHDKKSYRKMLWSAMGGGFIVAFLTCFKVGIYYLRLAPFGEAFLYSMNYSLGFIGIHITHSTLATKQPAMTASKIAASLDIKGPVEDGIKNLSELIVKVFRSQFIAFMGNILVAFPVAFIVALIYYWVVGKDIAGTEKAWHLIHELHPWHSYSLFHAGIAGVCLFAAGIISGYYDNAVVFKQLPERIRNQQLLKLIMPSFILKKLSRYIENNLGSLTGNFFLGIFLGSIGTMGHFFGLPIDIRHITFASGNLGLAVASLGTQIGVGTFAITVLGVLLIGFMNFIVSFGLALFVAIQSRRVSFKKTTMLVGYLFEHLLTKPKEFLFPPEDKESTGKELTH